MKGLLERFACGKPKKQPDNDLHDHDYESVVLYEPMGSMTFLCASKHQSRLQALAAKNPPGIHWQGTQIFFWRSIVYLKTGINIIYPSEKNWLFVCFVSGCHHFNHIFFLIFWWIFWSSIFLVDLFTVGRPSQHSGAQGTSLGPGIIVSLEHVTRMDIDGSETLAKVAREINAGGAAFDRFGVNGSKSLEFRWKGRGINGEGFSQTAYKIEGS